LTDFAKSSLTLGACIGAYTAIISAIELFLG
jgi:hypothetical protein